MSPFEALYGRSCRTPLNWSEPGERVIFGPDLVEEAEEKVRSLQANHRTAKCRQEKYANRRRRPLLFDENDYVYLRVSPMKGVQRFGIRGKLKPRYIGPFLILERYGTVAYKLQLPAKLSGVHDVFHVSQLKKCLKPPVDILLEDIEQLQSDLTYSEYPIKLLDVKERMTRKKVQKFYKIQWSNHSKDESTWETEEFLRTHHPNFWSSLPGIH